MDAIRAICEAPARARTALEAAEREDDVSDWLTRHGIDPDLGEPLAASGLKGFTFMDRDAVPEEVDIARGLADTLTVLESKLRSRSVTARLETADRLPRVYGFGSELNQVWQNLIDNAIDAAGVEGHVMVTATARGDSIVVRVADDGLGIPDEHRARVFDPFFTTKPVGQGTGLGLDLVRRVVHLHNGDVDFTSQPGRTSFRVRLPAYGARGRIPG